MISSWIHKFADTAEKALSTEFTRQGIQTQKERAVFVQNLLGNADDTSGKKRPSIWESAYDDPDAWQEVRFQIGCGLPVVFAHRPSFQGIFQGRLVVRTFFEHMCHGRSILLRLFLKSLSLDMIRWHVIVG